MSIEMKLNMDLIKAERERRAWSQNHLADAAGLSLRTIQRIESQGIASKETTLAIASALSTSVEQLLAAPNAADNKRTGFRFGWPLATASVLLVSSLLIAQQAFAKQLMLDVKLGLEDEKHDSRLITEAGEPAEIRVDGKIRVIITPTLTKDGDVFLQTEIYTYKDGDYSLVGKPGLIIKDNAEALVTSDSEQTGGYRLAITPHVIQKP
jgi:transcriptional regulator with XRE-family HTH domain